MTGRYDEDYSDPRQYCAHGTFIGSWWGPDYMCYYCETGESPPTPLQVDNRAFARRLHDARKDMEGFDALTAHLARSPYNARIAQALVDCVTEQGWPKAIWFCRRQEVFR